MAEYRRHPGKFAAKGVSLTHPPDLMPPGLYPILTNVEPRVLGGLQARLGLDPLGNPTLPDSIHSIRRLNDSTDNSYAIFLGADTSLYDTTSAVAIATDFAGTPMSMVPFRPPQTPRPWMYVSDSVKSVKVLTDRTVYNMGISIPTTEPTVYPVPPVNVLGAAFDTAGDWAIGGTAGVTSTTTRISTTIAAIVATGGGWYSVVPTATTNLGMGMVVLVNSVEESVVYDVIQPVVDTVISGIIFDSGSSGECTVVLRDQSTGLRMNAVLTLNPGGANEENVFISSVTFGPNQEASVRCTTANAHGAGEAVSGNTALRMYLAGSYSAGNALVSNYIQSTIAVGTGTLSYTTSVNFASISGRPVAPDDYVHISIFMDDPGSLVEGRIIFDVDQSTNDYTRNAYYKTFRPSDLQTNIDGSETALEVGSGALDKLNIDEKVFNLLTKEQQAAIRQIGGKTGLLGTPIFTPVSISIEQAVDLGITEQALTNRALNAFPLVRQQLLNTVQNAFAPVRNAFSGLSTNPDQFITSAQAASGASQWTELVFRIGDMARIGSDPAATLINVKGIRVQLETTASVATRINSLWVGGTYGQDNPDTAPYLYTYRYRSKDTGAKSNPAPAIRSGWSVYRQGIYLAGTISADPQVDTIDFFRFGGNNASWRWVGSHPNTNGESFVDTFSDAQVAQNEELEFTNFRPFPVSDLPRSGTCNVVGSAVQWVSGSAFDTDWAPGSLIIIDGTPYSLYNSPESGTFLEIAQNAGVAASVAFELPDATIAATPMPALWGPDPLTGVMFGCGDGTGIVYWTNPNNPDGASDTNYLEISSPSEPLQNGFMWNGVAYVFSVEKLYRLMPGGVNGYVAQEVPNSQGLFGRYAFCVGPALWWVSKHGVMQYDGGQVTCLTNDSLYPLFPHDGEVGTDTNGYAAMGSDNPNGIRLFYTQDSLYLLFLSAVGPNIVTTCPLTSGFTTIAYATTIDVNGGTAPLTFTISAGALPTGLTIDSATGDITGTPTATGTFTFTILVTDALGQTDSLSCQMIVYPISACGVLADTIELQWAHNSRVGPFAGSTDGEITFIGVDPNDAKALIAVQTTDYGETWAVVDDTFPTLTNDISSFDCHQVSDTIYVATQENSTGRVAYHEFDLATATWTSTDTQVVASVTNKLNGCVSITYLSSGDLGLMYETNQENVSGTNYARAGYRYSTNGGSTWSSEVALGNVAEAINNNPGRVVADNAGRVQAFMGNADNTDFFGHYYVQSIRADHSLSTTTMWAGGSALAQIQSVFPMGDYCTYEVSGTTNIVYVCRMLFTGRYAIFESSDNMSGPTNPTDVRDGQIGSCFNGLGGSTYEASYPMISTRHDGTDLHFMVNSFSNSVPTWTYHKSAASPYEPGDLTPSGDADQAGPNFTTDIPAQELASTILTYGGTQYVATLRNSGNVGIGLVFNLIRLEDLPTDSGYTIEDWEADCS